MLVQFIGGAISALVGILLIATTLWGVATLTGLYAALGLDAFGWKETVGAVAFISLTVAWFTIISDEQEKPNE